MPFLTHTEMPKRARGRMLEGARGMLEGAQAPVSIEGCIYRVPFPIRRHKEDAYTPMVVSIGPFHYNCHPQLMNMERIKLKFCEAFLARMQITSESWIRHIQEDEPKVRACYSETVDLIKKEELVNIIYVDSGFILSLFCSCCLDDWSDDTLRLTPWLSTNIRLDLLLLENQLPFFILQDLFNLSTRKVSVNKKIPSFLELTFRYFAHYNTSELNFENINMMHFTDLMRTFHLQHPRESRPPRTSEPLTHLPSAAELSEAGVKFKKNTRSNCLLDLTFSEGVLQIPPLTVFDSTERLFRNMVALEQCHYPFQSYITDYLLVLDFLVTTSKDVDILVRKKVMANGVGDTDSVANMFNSLLKNNVQVKFNSHYFNLCRDLNAFYNNPWRNLKSTLRRDYCKTPWQTAATFAAILLLFLTLVQSVCSVWQTIKQ